MEDFPLGFSMRATVLRLFPYLVVWLNAFGPMACLRTCRSALKKTSTPQNPFSKPTYIKLYSHILYQHISAALQQWAMVLKEEWHVPWILNLNNPYTSEERMIS